MANVSTVTISGPKEDIEKLFNLCDVENIDFIDYLCVKKSKDSKQYIGIIRQKEDRKIVMSCKLKGDNTLENIICKNELSLCVRVEESGECILNDTIYIDGFSKNVDISEFTHGLTLQQIDLITSGYIDEESTVDQVIIDIDETIFDHTDIEEFDLSDTEHESMPKIRELIQKAIDVYVQFDETSKKCRSWEEENA